MLDMNCSHFRGWNGKELQEDTNTRDDTKESELLRQFHAKYETSQRVPYSLFNGQRLPV
jgi:hypothetical protein